MLWGGLPLKTSVLPSGMNEMYCTVAVYKCGCASEH
jgi:hypothetical protein